MAHGWLMGVVAALAFASAVAAAAGPQGGIDPGRVNELAAMLGDRPFAFGPGIGDRAAWEALRAAPAFASLVRRAERIAAQPVAELPDELYLEFSRTGSRDDYQDAWRMRTKAIAPLVLAECLEAKGRFIEPFERLVEAICAQRTWVYPAHDAKLENFNGTRITIDLSSSAVAHELSQARRQLGARLSGRARELIESNVRRRVLDPFRGMIAGERQADWWIAGENNWNAVCLAGVTGAALAMLESREDRAIFAAAAEKYSLNSLKGFSADGYCSEGLGYWNYGFSHYVELSELLWQATEGELDLLDRQITRAIALYPSRLEIAGGIYPAYADCTVGAKPDRLLVSFLNRRLSLGVEQWNSSGEGAIQSSLNDTMMHVFANSASRKPARPPATADSADQALRGWFDAAHVLAARPKPRSASRLAVSLKGGHNAEHHNHNDVGSYVVVVGSSALLLDPGAEVYTARTFGKDRYKSNLLNSFGHPVPVVAGQLQRTGREAHAEVVNRSFGDRADTLVLDIRSCYDVQALRKLQRGFVFSREGAGSLVVSDEIECSSPTTFSTALITLGKWRQVTPSSLLIYDETEALRVDLDSGGAELHIEAETIDEQVRTPTRPTRIGISLVKPVIKAAVTATITPAPLP